MIDLYYWPTPNGHKITIFLEETETPYTVKLVHIGKGEQFAPAFLAISPNNRMPAIVDPAPEDGGAPIAVFESAAILQYLGDKTGKLFPKAARARNEVTQWLMWQMGGLGPMAGQLGHFNNYAAEKIPYAIDRYKNEVNRLFGVMNRRLEDRPFLAGDYSIADIASFPWVLPERFEQDMAAFPHLERWRAEIAARPAVVKGLAVSKDQYKPMSEEDKKILFGQTSR